MTTLASWLALSVLIFSTTPLVIAQQTVFNVPSADVLEKAKVYGELDAALHPSPFTGTFLPRLVSGVGGNVEIGLNFSGLAAPDTGDLTLSPAIKYRIWKNGDWTILLGDTVSIAPNGTQLVGNYAYGIIARSFRSGVRLGVGPYHYSARTVASAQRAGAQISWEQPISKTWTFAADWISGRHANGYTTPGFIWKPSARLTIYSAYQIGNGGVSQGNHGFEFEAGWNFN